MAWISPARKDARRLPFKLSALLAIGAVVNPLFGQTGAPAVSRTMIPAGAETIVVPMPASPSPGPGPKISVESYSDYGPTGNDIATQLRAAPPKLYDFDRASLRDVLRLLADDAGIPFVSMQESSTLESTLVTFTLKMSPFQALETIADANGIALSYQHGVWFMRPINEKELIGRIYKLKYNPEENVEYQANGSQSGANAYSGGGGGNPVSGGGTDISLQGATTVFKVDTPKMVDEIKSLLGIPTSSVNAPIASEASVGNFGGIPPAGASNSGGSALMARPPADGGPQVLYNADVGTLYIVATRQQQEWVEGYLAAVDRPQALIGIEVKFFETTRNPEKDLGVNWANTLGPNNPFTVNAQVTGAANSNLLLNPISGALSSLATAVGNGASTSTTTGASTTTTGNTTTGNGTTTTTAGAVTTSNGPFSLVLNTSQASVSIAALLQDQSTSLVQYPRVLTLNNREVVIRAVENDPVLASTATVTNGGAGTTAQSVSYLPIGTIINVLPKTMPDNSVVLNVAITVSSIVSQTIIAGNSYPVASSRVYNAALQVDSGYTLAVGGFESASDTDLKNGVPLLRDIPGIGQLFKSKSHSRSKRNLLIFITPTIMFNRAATTGISQTPETTIPIHPGEPEPPAFTSKGELVGGVDTVDEAESWLERQVQYFRELNREDRADKKSIKQLVQVIHTAEMLLTDIMHLEEQNPARMQQIISQEERIRKIIEELHKIRTDSGRNLMDYMEEGHTGN